MNVKFSLICPKCDEIYQTIVNTEGMLIEEERYAVLRRYFELIETVKKCIHGKPDTKIEKERKKEKAKKGTINIGQTKVKLNGKPFVIDVDTFDGDDWFGGYFKTEEEAIKYAKQVGGQMHKTHAYDKNGNHIGEGGTF